MSCSLWTSNLVLFRYTFGRHLHTKVELEEVKKPKNLSVCTLTSTIFVIHKDSILYHKGEVQKWCRTLSKGHWPYKVHCIPQFPLHHKTNSFFFTETHSSLQKNTKICCLLWQWKYEGCHWFQTSLATRMDIISSKAMKKS